MGIQAFRLQLQFVIVFYTTCDSPVQEPDLLQVPHT